MQIALGKFLMGFELSVGVKNTFEWCLGDLADVAT
jgi:hypothetical protein